MGGGVMGMPRSSNSTARSISKVLAIRLSTSGVGVRTSPLSIRETTDNAVPDRIASRFADRPRAWRTRRIKLASVSDAVGRMSLIEIFPFSYLSSMACILLNNNSRIDNKCIRASPREGRDSFKLFTWLVPVGDYEASPLSYVFGSPVTGVSVSTLECGVEPG